MSLQLIDYQRSDQFDVQCLIHILSFTYPLQPNYSVPDASVFQTSFLELILCQRRFNASENTLRDTICFIEFPYRLNSTQNEINSLTN